jgi:hypothetical protein
MAFPTGLRACACLGFAAHGLIAAAEAGHIHVCAGLVARFYGEGVRWALSLPLPELFRWRDLIPRVRDADPLASAVWLRTVPKSPE